MRTLAVALLVTVLSQFAFGQEMQFKKVELRTAYSGAEQGANGRLAVTPEAIRFVSNKGAEFFSIPSSAVTDLFYSRVSGRRIKSTVVSGVLFWPVAPAFFFSKGKKHYLTISFEEGNGSSGALEFKLHKSNYRGVLRAVESVSDVTVQFDQEGIKDSKETVAVRTSGSDQPAISMATLEIDSVPDGAEIEIDGSFVGTTPRIKQLEPGKYKIKLSKVGYKEWKREIEVGAGEQVPVKIDLQKK